MKRWALKQRQSLPLGVKITLSQKRIREFYDSLDGEVYIAFSGGKDSTVLLHLVRSLYPQCPAVFCNTGLEYPEIIQFVRDQENITTLYPKLTFKEVIIKYGYPVISKEVSQKLYEIRTSQSKRLLDIRLNGYGNAFRSGKLPKKWHYLISAEFKISHKCCYHLKKAPSKTFEKRTGLRPYLGEMAQDSIARTQTYLKYGCNALNTSRIVSRPLGFWLEEDIWDYIKLNNLNYSSIYNMGYKNTGCMFCMFGIHLDKIDKFDIMKKTHPKLYDYCINDLGCGLVRYRIKTGSNT